MKKKHFFLTALAIVLVLTATMGSAWSYFTTYTEARGGYTISLGDETTVDETFSAWTKHVVIDNKEGSSPVFIRIKAFSGSEYKLVYSDGSGKWTPGEDGYYYYSDVVEGGASTDELLVRIMNVPEHAKGFNVIVVYESTPALYDDAGKPYADWTVKLDSGTTEGGAN